MSDIHALKYPLEVFSKTTSMNINVNPLQSIRFQNVTIRKNKPSNLVKSIDSETIGYKPLSIRLEVSYFLEANVNVVSLGLLRVQKTKLFLLNVYSFYEC